MMNRSLLNFWPALVCIRLLAPTHAQATPPKVGTAEQAIRAALAERLAMDPADVELSELTLDPALPVNAPWTVRLPDYAFGSGHVSLTLDAGHHPVKVNPKVTLYAQLPVVDAEVSPGSQVSFHSERRSLAELHGGAAVDAAYAWDATVSLHRGRVLTGGVVRRHPDLREGAQVTLVVVRGSLAVSAPGQLLTDALVGEPAHVLNLATKAELVGTLQPDGRIHLGGT